MKYGLLLLLALGVFGTALPTSAAPDDIYDSKADGAVQVDAALAQARSTHRRVLLDFGANWCPWCHRLHSLFTTNHDVAAALSASYVLVMIDVNTRGGIARNAALNQRYGNPVRFGLPVLVVLDSDGRQLCTKDSGELEEGNGHSPAKVIAFLNQWSPKRD